jgi:nucleoside phosphorylase
MPTEPIRAQDVKGKVHVVIVTIRLDEYEAMEAQLGVTRPVRGGNNSYQLAEVELPSGNKLSVAVTRCTHQGNLSAQSVTNNVIQDLDPSWIFLVGIAGGVPDNEFSLGDVIFASALHDFSFGGLNEAGKFQSQSYGGKMHPAVERFLQTRIAGINKRKLINLAGFRKRSKFGKHPPVFPEGKSLRSSLYGAPVFRKKVATVIDARFPAGRRTDGPRIYAGPCANGDLVLKNTQLLQKWQDSAKQVAEVETELAGVYEAARSSGRQNYPVLAIRGLSDIVGLNRTAMWTQYACDTAAAVAHAVLRSDFIDFNENLPPFPSHRI